MLSPRPSVSSSAVISTQSFKLANIRLESETSPTDDWVYCTSGRHYYLSNYYPRIITTDDVGNPATCIAVKDCVASAVALAEAHPRFKPSHDWTVIVRRGVPRVIFSRQWKRQFEFMGQTIHDRTEAARLVDVFTVEDASGIQDSLMRFSCH